MVLALWELEEDWDKIASTPKGIWERQVHAAAEKRNKTKLLEECQTKQRGVTKQKTKTTTII